MKFFQILAEGGQTWAHRVRMVKQVLKMTLNFSMLSALIYLIYAFAHLDPILFKSSYYHLKAEYYAKDIIVSSRFWETLSHEKATHQEKIISINLLKKHTTPKVHLLLTHAKQFLLKSIQVAYLTFIVMVLFFLIRGASSKRKKHASGKKRRDSSLLRLQLILTKKASPIKIGKLPLVKGTETQHILVTGGTGSGKTNSFHHILPQIREQKGIIIDTSGLFIDRYYNPSKDILFNPFDDRGASWHPWIECQDCFDFDNLAESIIPQTHHDHENYWRTAARSLLSALLQKLSNIQKTSELARWMLYEPLDQLAAFIQDTKAAAHIDTSSEKTAASIRSVAASFLGSLEYINDTQTPFSIRQWIQSPQSNWLFLYAKPSQRATLNPLLSCWFSVAVRSLIQMKPDLKRRVWFIIDELPTLHKLKELESLICESRKYGGCALLALQSPSQLEEIYGRHLSKTILGNCATRIIFAEHDPEIAETISKALGECEIKEYQEGISYGAHEVRDGVNLSLQTKKTPLVTPTDIQSLKNNHAFIKLPGNLPITKICFKKHKNV